MVDPAEREMKSGGGPMDSFEDVYSSHQHLAGGRCECRVGLWLRMLQS